MQKKERKIRMMLQAGILIVGFLFLVKGADWFVEGSASIARKFGIPQLIIGLTIDASERINYDMKCGWNQYFEYFYYSRTYVINNKCGNTKVYLVL